MNPLAQQTAKGRPYAATGSLVFGSGFLWPLAGTLTTPAMTPAIVLSGDGASLNSGAVVPLPEGFLNENDIIVVVCQYRQQGTANSIDGYTRNIRINNGTTSLDVFWKRAGASETSPQVTHSFSSGRWYNWYVIRGAVESGDPFEASNTSTSGSSTTHNLPAVTTLTDNALILAIGGSNGIEGTSSYSFPNATFNTLRYPLAASTTVGQWVAQSAMGAAGTTGTGTITYNNALGASLATLAVTSGLTSISGTPPTVESSSSGNVGTSPASTTLPAGVEEGDLLMLVVHHRSSVKPSVSGYTLLSHRLTNQGFANLSVFTKWAGASEAAPSITHGFSGGNHTWAMAAIRGANSLGIAGGGIWNRNGGTTTPLWVFGAIHNNCLIMAVAGSEVAVTFSNWTYPSNALTSVVNFNNGSGSSVGMAEGTQAAAEWVNAGSVDQGTSGETQTMTFLIAPQESEEIDPENLVALSADTSLPFADSGASP